MVCAHFFFFNDTATTEIYTLSLHDALPISQALVRYVAGVLPSLGVSGVPVVTYTGWARSTRMRCLRSEEHTSELQSQFHLVCRLLLEKKNKTRSLTSTATTQQSRSNS